MGFSLGGTAGTVRWLCLMINALLLPVLVPWNGTK